MLRISKILIAASLEEYQGEHKAPDKDDAPIWNLTLVYPEDVYSAEGARYYGDGHSFDGEAHSLLCRLKGKPNARVKIYRAVPKILSNVEEIKFLERCRYMWQRRETKPQGAPTPPSGTRYYDYLCERIAQLQQEPADNNQMGINPGDWVTPILAYAKEHGEANLNNKYRVLQKTVPASTLYTDGNSLVEWGYCP